MKVYVIIIFYDIDSVMVFGWGFFVYGILWIWFDVNMILLVFFIVRKFYLKGCLKIILMVGFLICDILFVNMLGILLNELFVFINWLFIDKVFNF